MKSGQRFLTSALFLFLANFGNPARADVTADDVRVVHRYANASGVEIANLIAVAADKLTPLLPQGYVVVPAATLELGRQDQGVLVITNFRGQQPLVDDRSTGRDEQVAIDQEPSLD